MSPSLRQGFGALRHPEGGDTLDRAIVRADLAAACRRRALPLLRVLGRSEDSARRALRDADRRAAALHGMRDLLRVSGGARRGRSI